MRLLGHEIGRTTVQRILDADGIVPAPERRKHLPWATFLKAHWGAIAAMDFFKVEVLSFRGPVRYAVLVVMDLQSRRVQIAGIVQEPYEDACRYRADSPAQAQPEPECVRRAVQPFD